jgi:hypothetical protein
MHLARELCRQVTAYILSSLTPFLFVWGVRKGGWGGGHFGPEAKNLHVNVRIFFISKP